MWREATMRRSRLAIVGGFLLFFTLAAHGSSAEPGASCATTVAPTRAFAEPSPSLATRFWYGSEGLAVWLDRDGTWQGMRDKLFWWREGYNGATETRPRLTVTARRLDGEAPPVHVPRATNAHHEVFGGWSMLMMLEFPTAGCWEVTGRYKGQTLSFVVQVGA